jgi:VWFA-related protein
MTYLPPSWPKRLLALLALGLFVLAPGPAAAQSNAQPRVLTLEEAIKLGQSHSPALVVARASEAKADAESQRTNSQRLPQVNFVAGYDRTLASEFSSAFDSRGPACPGLSVDTTRPIGDRVAVVGFKNLNRSGGPMAAVDVVSDLTDNRERLHLAIDDLDTSNGTPLYDALGRVAEQIFRDPPRDELRGRRAIVALTDGVDSSSNSDFGEARAKLNRAGVATYFIQVSTEDYVEDRLLKDCEDDGRLTLSAKQLERFRRLFVPQLQKEDYQDFCRLGQFERMDISRRLYNLGRQEMNEMARGSGGKNFEAASLTDARAAFAQVAHEIGTQYSLGYYPLNKTRDGAFRQIKVELRGVKDGTVRAREGYYAPK